MGYPTPTAILTLAFKPPSRAAQDSRQSKCVREYDKSLGSTDPPVVVQCKDYLQSTGYIPESSLELPQRWSNANGKNTEPPARKQGRQAQTNSPPVAVKFSVQYQMHKPQTSQIQRFLSPYPQPATLYQCGTSQCIQKTILTAQTHKHKQRYSNSIPTTPIHTRQLPSNYIRYQT